MSVSAGRKKPLKTEGLRFGERGQFVSGESIIVCERMGSGTQEVTMQVRKERGNTLHC